MAARTEPAGDAARALDALRRIVRALRISSRAVERDVGISGAQLFVLRQLAGAPRLSLNDLVARTLTHQSSVSEVVSRLVERGLVSRRAAADDARRAELQLTARGRGIVRHAPPTLQSALLEGFTRLPAAQRRAVAEGLVAWIEASGLGDVEPTMFFESPSARGRRASAAGGDDHRARNARSHGAASPPGSAPRSSSRRPSSPRATSPRSASPRSESPRTASRRSKRVDG